MASKPIYEAPTGERLLNLNQVAERYDVAIMTIHRWRKRPDMKFPKSVLFGARHFYRERDLDEWDMMRVLEDEIEISRANAALRKKTPTLKRTDNGSVIFTKEHYELFEDFHKAAMKVLSVFEGRKGLSTDELWYLRKLEEANIASINGGMFIAPGEDNRPKRPRKLSELDRFIAACTGPGGEIYGHRD